MVQNMRGYCKAVGETGATALEKARACCGFGQDTCPVSCTENTVLEFDVHRKMQQKFQRVSAHYKYLFDQSRDKFIDFRLRKVLCDNGCRDEMSITHGNPLALTDYKAKLSLQRDLYDRSMGMMEKLDLLTSGTKACCFCARVSC